MTTDRKEALYAMDLSAAQWTASSASNDGNTCVEWTPLPDGGLAIRDGRNPERPHLCFDADEVEAFRLAVTRGEFAAPSS